MARARAAPKHPPVSSPCPKYWGKRAPGQATETQRRAHFYLCVSVPLCDIAVPGLARNGPMPQLTRLVPRLRSSGFYLCHLPRTWNSTPS
ncbi:MAG: hypothetical protein AVDCRST_MAG68-4507 [uncultured Gemmatimonadetes bacterium]|uniref:Uncharacterized protein n=1 Tax=uncultured Gemmatimonadota bacterium TaxID=203437 RepID=A0A6J4MK79_9BACT|nr:MAG: hypothetical protein AVDCRST_MAG68-4507 [uncultured Gemmatimonadota bacterium]